MKKILLICAIMVVGITNASFSTPAYDYDYNTDEILNLNDSIQHLDFTFNEYPSVSFEGLYSSSQGDAHNFDTLIFSGLWWAPSWDQSTSTSSPDWSNFNRRYKKFPKEKKWKPKHKPSQVPEPATILLFGSGLIGLAFISRINRKE